MTTDSRRFSRIRYFLAESADAAANLALEEYFLTQTRPGELIFYLWRNSPVVVIGRNQNAEKECDLHMMRSEKIMLVRRRTGGGAVYQDLGNLNYTFVCREEDEDEPLFTAAVLGALGMAGITAEKSGRNDLIVTAEGRKCSGTASLRSGGNSVFHGTLMLDVDIGRLERVLTVDPEKLALKGLDSVRSRVINLCSLVPELTAEKMEGYLCAAVKELLAEGGTWTEEALPDPALYEERYRFYASSAWTYDRFAEGNPGDISGDISR